MLIVAVAGIILSLCVNQYFSYVSNIVFVIGFIEGIIYLVKSKESFNRTYVQEHRGWF